MTTNLIAYHSDAKIKLDILAQIVAHRKADELVKGRYWEDGKGCAVGCTLHSGDHMEYETRFGIPVMLAHLEDCIFEGLPNGLAKEWPERFMGAIQPGADLSLVGWQFLHWLLTDETVNPGITHELVRDAVKCCADVIAPLAKGQPVAARSAAAIAAASAARSAAAIAAESAESAASAAIAAESAAWSAAESAASAAESAAIAASAAWSVERAAWSVESAARSEESAARSARNAARSAAYKQMANKLINLLEAA